ncbi:MAG: cell division protein ZipA C-terminal FtsZ-binding domain-containing protein [Rudaea sp.]
MTPLQLGLIVAGVLLVVAVIVYNVWQERRVRRRLADAHPSPRRSEPAAAPRMAERVEPTLHTNRTAADPARGTPAFRPGDLAPSTLDPVAANPASATASPPGDPSTVADVVTASGEAIELPSALAEAATAPATSARSAPGAKDASPPDHEIECLIRLQPAAPIAAGALAAGLHARIGKPLRWFGRLDPRSDWKLLQSDTPGRFREIVACMLLADRNGAASRAQLDAFARIVGDVATSVSAPFEPPDVAREVARAESLDRLCAELDVQIGLTVQMPDPASIAGTRLRGVAEAAGFRLAQGGRFEFIQEDTGAVLYTLQNLRPDPFSAEMLRVTATNGVVFLLDVARLAEPARAFDQMKLAARRIATTLGAELVDDNRRPLDDAALATIREQVEAAAEALQAVHVPPGSPRALALFSA